MRRSIFCTGGALVALLLTTAIGHSAETSASADGSVRVPAFDLPYSSYASRQAMAATLAQAPLSAPSAGTDPGKLRVMVDDMLAPLARQVLAANPAEVVDTKIAGIPVTRYVPRSGRGQSQRILIELHGGLFLLGGRNIATLSAAPIAAATAIEVDAVDYGLYPEHRHPDAANEVAAVYQALQKTRPASAIGFYGCSAGGTLAVEALVDLEQHGAALPGALVLASAGLDAEVSGDSSYVAPALSGIVPEAPPKLGYFADVPRTDPVAFPSTHPDLLARFPATLALTASRDVELSPTIEAERRLAAAGTDTRLHAWDGLGHCFYVMSPDLPESHQAIRFIADFFDRHLSR